MTTQISNEAAFVTACCRELTTEEAVSQSARLVGDWPRVASLAKSHGVSAIVLPHAQRALAEGVCPRESFDDIRASASRDTAITSRLSLLLIGILHRFGELGIPLICLKGATLARMLYDNPAVRPSSDIDLLCREEDFTAAHNALEALGYAPDSEPELPERHSHDETHFERRFRHPDGIGIVELHVDAIKLGVRPSASDSIWTRLQDVELDGVTARTLGLEDMLVMLCIHLHRHGFNRLIWLKDIDLLVRKLGDRIDWDLVRQLSAQEGADPSLWYTLRLAHLMLNTPLPDSVLDSLRPSPIVRRGLDLIWSESRVMNLESETKRRAVQFSVLESWRGMIPSLFLMGRRRAKVRILLRRILPL